MQQKKQKELIEQLDEAFCKNWTGLHCIDWVFNMNSAENGFIIPKWFHWPNTYADPESYNSRVYTKISDAMNKATDNGLTKEQAVLKEIKKIREDIANCNLAICNTQDKAYKKFAQEALKFYK